MKVLLDPERLDGGADKDKFLGVFYDFYIHWLVTPFVEPNEPDRFDVGIFTAAGEQQVLIGSDVHLEVGCHLTLVRVRDNFKFVFQN